jgi:hypothetical protein
MNIDARRLWAKLAAPMVVVAAATVACSSSSSGSSSSANSAASTVGQTCNSDSACSALPGGYCTKAGVCSRPCTLHSDCGCPDNTTNADLANGKCGDACISFTNETVCVKTCATNKDCFGATTCISNAGAGFSVCG